MVYLNGNTAASNLLVAVSLFSIPQGNRLLQ